MLADSGPMFAPDRRGNRLERHSFEMAPDGLSHRLLLRASSEIADQFQSIKCLGYRASAASRQLEGWTHCLQAAGPPHADARELADLLSDVVTLPRLASIDFALARDWYKTPEDGVPPGDWRNTPDGERVHVGKYWISSPAAKAQAGRSLVRRLAEVVRRHPLLASADVVVAVPGHDRTYLSFGERVAASVSAAVGLPLVKVTTSHEFRPPAKDLPGAGAVEWGQFAVPQSLAGKAAVIIDDVFRTGRTMSATGSAVRRAGATCAFGLTAVRTMRR